MALTATQLATVQRRSGESHKTSPMVDEATIQAIADESGLILDDAAQAPTHADYTPTYDLYAIAATVWDEKAALTAEGYDFAAEGGSFSRSQHYRHCVEQGKRMRAKQSNLSA